MGVRILWGSGFESRLSHFMRPSVKLLYALTLSLGAATANAQQSPTDDSAQRPALDTGRVAGCYDVTRTAWYPLESRRFSDVVWPDTLPAPLMGARTLESLAQHEPPFHLHLSLDSARFDRTVGHVLEPPGPDTLGRTRIGGRIWYVKRDTLVLTWSTGFAGVTLVLQQKPYGFDGTAIGFTDVISGSLPAARVVLLRTRCREDESR